MDTPGPDRSDEDALPPLSGVAALADRAVDPVRVARVLGAVALALGLSSGLFVEHLLSGANVEPAAARDLHRNAAPPAAPDAPPARVAVLLVDGMRTDEASALSNWNRDGVSRGRIRLPLPTLSRPFQHLLFTGVPHSVSGVRTNRYTGRARFDSVLDRVRDEHGTVIVAADGLDWIQRMHGADDDGGSSRRDALDDIGATWLPALQGGAAPGLLVLHAIRTDGTAHHGDAEGHREALEQADALLGTLLDTELSVVCLSDHGHVDGGGHGGPETIVARSPLLVRDAAGRLPTDLGEVSAGRLAGTLASLLGVSRPRHAVGSSLLGEPDENQSRGAEAAQSGVERSVRALFVRRRLGGLFAFVLLFMALGPIKRAYGFDRATPWALFAFPCLVVGLHLLLARPLSLSAIDSRTAHVIRVVALGTGSAALAFVGALMAGRGAMRIRVWRSAASVAWGAAASALVAFVSCGFALGPWPLSGLTIYLPLLFGGAAAAGLGAMGLALLFNSVRAA
ncbi:MAG: hypothetical protein AB8I08_24425 [Sandaracinaceae bacterium]